MARVAQRPAAEVRQPIDRIDRFATHRAFVDAIPDVKAAGGWPAVAALFVLWDRTNAKTGMAAMSVNKLAKLLGSQRVTARAALKVLAELKLITGDGEGNWVVYHSAKEAAPTTPTERNRRRKRPE